MPHNLRKWCYLALMAVATLSLLGCLTLSPDNAYAQVPDDIHETGINPDANTFFQGSYFCPHNWDGITSRVVICVQNIIRQAGSNVLSAIISIYQPVVVAFLLLATIIYGALILMGSVRNLTGDTFFFIFKLAVVAQFSLIFSEWMFDVLFNSMQGLLGAVSNYATVGAFSACSDESVMPEVFALDREHFSAWDKIDCMFINLLGIGVATYGGLGAAGISTSVGVGAFMALLFFTGGVGIIIFLVAILFILTLVISIVRAIKIYLMAIITVAFLIVISPFVIPLILFEQTKPYFMNWVKVLASYMLLPVFLVAFLSMMVAGFDAVFFRGTSSLFSIVAGQASQPQLNEPFHFSMAAWLQEGIVADGHNIEQVRAEVSNGTRIPVGANIPGKNAIGLLEAIAVCRGDYVEWLPEIQTQEQADLAREVMGDFCPDDGDFTELYTMLACAIRPVVPAEGVGGGMPPEGESCLAQEGFPYYGFELNEEILNYAIAPNMPTDEELRADAQEEEGCGWNPLCLSWRGVRETAGLAFSSIANVSGALIRVSGVLIQKIGNAVKSAATIVEGACRITGVPGSVCDDQGGALMVAGNVVHASGTFVNFGGRAVMNGWMEALGELYEGWFDVLNLDVQKVASYKCRENRLPHGLLSNQRVEDFLSPDGRELVNGEGLYAAYVPYLACDDLVVQDPSNRKWGVREFVLEVIYSMGAALLLGFLMMKWLNYIPLLAKEMLGNVQIMTNVLGEDRIRKGSDGLHEYFDDMQSPAQRLFKRKRGEIE